MHTLVLGASTNPDRASYQAIERLVANQIPVSAIGLRPGEVDIQQGTIPLTDIHTVTLYLNPQRQEEWYNIILGLPTADYFQPRLKTSTSAVGT
ncbi:MAG: CoA-binding protein [Saprospiraceae bacterium]